MRLSVDDFGTGYSSLSYLQRLPVQEVKIDRSFVTALDAGTENVAIVRAIIDLGRNLGLEVVAEGVEDQATWNRLASLGCDLVQGWHLARAMPIDDLLPWLAAQGSRPPGRRSPSEPSGAGGSGHGRSCTATAARGARCRPAARCGRTTMPAYPAASSPVATIAPVRPTSATSGRGDQRAADDAGQDHRQRDAVGAGEDLLVQLALQRGLAEHLDQHRAGAPDHRPAEQPGQPGVTAIRLDGTASRSSAPASTARGRALRAARPASVVPRIPPAPSPASTYP